MAAGFVAPESRLEGPKNTAAICLKNVALNSLAGLLLYLVECGLIYTDVVGGFMGFPAQSCYARGVASTARKNG